MVHAICQGLFPTSLCQRRPDGGVLPPLCAWAHHKTLSCICHPNVHLMGSSAPWRSELIISPCAPILWYLSAGHGPAHQKLRPPGAHQSKTSWQCESNFIIKIIKCMHDTPNRSSNSSKTLHRPTIQSQSNQKGNLLGQHPQELESFRKGLSKTCIVT
jgi:hypothetical protein